MEIILTQYLAPFQSSYTHIQMLGEDGKSWLAKHFEIIGFFFGSILKSYIFFFEAYSKHRFRFLSEDIDRHATSPTCVLRSPEVEGYIYTHTDTHTDTHIHTHTHTHTHTQPGKHKQMICK